MINPTLIDACLGYHNLKVNEQSSYLTTFSCPFKRYRYIQSPFGVSLVGDIFQEKIDNLFNRMSNVFGIAYHILIEGSDELGRGNDAVLDKVLRICRQANMKLKKDVFSEVHQHTFFGVGILQQDVSPDPMKV